MFVGICFRVPTTGLISSYCFAFMGVFLLAQMRIAVFIWVFLVSLSAFLVCIDVTLVSARCQSDQQALLLQLKEELKFHPSKSKRLVSWSSTTDCCNWSGVTCDDGGHVIKLNLSNDLIYDGIDNSRLFSLHYLQNLDLSFNNFNSSLSAMFGNLTGLLYLNLSNAGFSGRIPYQISKLTNLTTLDLSMFYYLYHRVAPLKFENPNLATIFQNFTQLRELYLDGANIYGKEWCQALSSSSPNLQVLSMSNCNLSGPFHPSFAQLQSLKVICLSGNNFSAPVPEFFGNFSSLIELLLEACGLQGTFPESVFRVRTLEILDLRNNNLLQGYFPDSLGENALNTLLLSNTDFSGTLPTSIGNLQNLSRIELASCKFVGPIPSTMENLSQLAYFDFSSNNFSGSLPSLSMARNLTWIDLSHNQLAGDILSINWDALQSLIYIDLRNNSLNGSIPSSLFKNPSLQKIQLSFNEFQGQVHEFINVPSLDKLDLSSNKLEGLIPQSLFQLKKLNVLSLSSNKLNGTIKLEWIQRLSDLTTLDLSYNNLTVDAGASNSTSSAFPPIKTLKLASCNMKVFPDLSNNSELFYLDLSDNQIGGVIPDWVFKVDKWTLQYLNLSGNQLVAVQDHPASSLLLVLDLRNNKLQGNIPVPPPSAVYVDYSNNRFNSSIPPDIVNNYNFFFSMSNNELTGGIPASICKASYLQVLDLSANHLNGRIPSCLIERSDNLGVLNLRDNNFDGEIPDQFPMTCRLKTLDLSGNRLEGTVPKSLANCAMLEVLNLESNLISDAFPCHLWKITSLRVLVLRNNKFYGPIGCPKISNTWERLQIVDLASNNFNGTIPARFLTTWKAMMDDITATYDHLCFQLSEFTGLYYEDSITVTTKGLKMKLLKILTAFTSNDFSSNNFEGPIPEVIGELTALYTLNMSHNALTGQIPSSLGNLSQLESLDFSENRLSGAIPEQLAALTFLSFLNLSYNNLSGMIPTGTQIQSFSASSYEGNEELCGAPLKNNCSSDHESIPKDNYNSHSGKDINWVLVSAEVGYVFGLGIVVGPLLYWRRWRIWYYKHVDRILIRIFPRLEERSWNYRNGVRGNRKRKKQQWRR